jgi:hypothetical protein
MLQQLTEISALPPTDRADRVELGGLVAVGAAARELGIRHIPSRGSSAGACGRLGGSLVRGQAGRIEGWRTADTSCSNALTGGAVGSGFYELRSAIA